MFRRNSLICVNTAQTWLFENLGLFCHWGRQHVINFFFFFWQQRKLFRVEAQTRRSHVQHYWCYLVELCWAVFSHFVLVTRAKISHEFFTVSEKSNEYITYFERICHTCSIIDIMCSMKTMLQIPLKRCIFVRYELFTSSGTCSHVCHKIFITLWIENYNVISLRW